MHFMCVFFKYILLIMLLQFPLSPIFPFCPLSWCFPFPTAISPPYFTSMGPAYEFFGFSTSCTVLNLLLPILYLSVQYFLIRAPFFPFFLFTLPADKLLYDLHVYDSVPVLLVCLVYFLDTVADSYLQKRSHKTVSSFSKETLQARGDWQEVF